VQIKNVIKTICVFSLVFVMAGMMFGCNPKVEESEYKLPDQYYNIKYYFDQGFYGESTKEKNTAKWTLEAKTTGLMYTPDEKPGNEGLVTEIYPTDDQASASYRVYYYKSTFVMTATAKDEANKLIKDNFMNTFIGNHTDFAFDFSANGGVQESTIVTYNDLQYRLLNYTFTKDGVAYKGNAYFLLDGWNCYLVVNEVAADKVDTYSPIFIEMIKEFRLEPFESDNG